MTALAAVLVGVLVAVREDPVSEQRRANAAGAEVSRCIDRFNARGAVPAGVLREAQVERRDDRCVIVFRDPAREVAVVVEMPDAGAVQRRTAPLSPDFALNAVAGPDDRLTAYDSD